MVRWFVGFILFWSTGGLFCHMKYASCILPLSVDKKDLVVVDNDNEMYVQGVDQSVLLHRFCLLFIFLLRSATTVNHLYGNSVYRPRSGWFFIKGGA